MKRLIRLTLLAALVMCSSSAFAQKFGYINSQELIAAMPERDSVQARLTKVSDDYANQLESIQVEFNNKYQAFQKDYNTLSESLRQMKEKELQDLQNRFEEFQRVAQQDMQKMQQDLMIPIIERAQNAIKKVGQTNSFTMIYDLASGALAYYDEASMTNVLPMVKAELGIVK